MGVNMSAIFTGLLILELLILALLVMAGNKYAEYKSLAQAQGERFQLAFMAPASLMLLDKINFISRFPSAAQKIHEKIIRLYGSKEGLDCTRLFLAQVMSGALLTFIGFTFITVTAGGDYSIFIFGILMVPVVAYVGILDLDKKIKTREQNILIELPEFLNKIVLLVNAGETVQEAILKSGDRGAGEPNIDPDKNPLFVELQLVVNELRINRSFSDALEDFSRRCAIPEISVFTTTVLLNYRKGGEDFVQALRELSEQLWEKRKAIARTQGEEATSKLVFPMIVLFIVLMAIVASPAMMLFN